jgi:hypothetical protein
MPATLEMWRLLRDMAASSAPRTTIHKTTPFHSRPGIAAISPKKTRNLKCE